MLSELEINPFKYPSSVLGTLKPKQSVSLEQMNNSKIKSAQGSWNL